MRDICGILGVNRSSFYYQPREDPSEEVLRAEIEKLAGAYPRYGYRRITQLLVRQGYTAGTRRVARLMKDNNLLVSVKRACQTTKSLQGIGPWSNLLENLEVSHQDQVWVADITYVRLKGRFIYVCLLMDVFTRIIKAWQISQHLNQSLTLKPLQQAYATASLRFIIPIKACSIFQRLILPRSKNMALRFPSPNADALGRMDMPKDSFAPSKRKKLTSMTIKASPRPEIASGILSHRCITRNAHTRR